MIVIGGVYKTKSGDLTRIFRGNPTWFMSGRGSTPRLSVPYNHYRPQDLAEPTVAEIQQFLAEEVQSGMTQTWNK